MDFHLAIRKKNEMSSFSGRSTRLEIVMSREVSQSWTSAAVFSIMCKL